MITARCLSVMLVAFLAATSASAEITADQVAGKTLTLDKNKFLIGPDGSLTGQTQKGEAVVGTWQVNDGNWCRTITEPARLAGSACESASIKGKTLTLTRSDGTKSDWKMK